MSEKFGVGETYTFKLTSEARHSAVAYGNEGVDVVATPALVGMLEIPCHMYLMERLNAGEGTVGTKVNVEHLAAAPTGADIEAHARVAIVEGRKITFDVEALWGEMVLMRGQHQRAIVELERFFAGLPKL